MTFAVILITSALFDYCCLKIWFRRLRMLSLVVRRLIYWRRRHEERKACKQEGMLRFESSALMLFWRIFAIIWWLRCCFDIACKFPGVNCDCFCSLCLRHLPLLYLLLKIKYGASLLMPPLLGDRGSCDRVLSAAATVYLKWYGFSPRFMENSMPIWCQTTKHLC